MGIVWGFLKYHHPKIADGQPDEAMVYSKCSKLIATELFYLFSLLSTNGR